MSSNATIGNNQKSDITHQIIVIGREFGSGGRTIGRKVASRLGFEYFDTELLDKAAKDLGVSPDLFKEHDEKKPSALKALLQGAYGIPDNFHTVPISGERLYNIQTKIIKDISQKKSCVIVGRNADFVLRNHPGLLSVFLHSPIEKRTSRIIKRGDAKTREEALSMAKTHDKRRESFYNYYTGDKKWGVASNYHLCIDTSLIDENKVVEIICSIAQIKQK